MRDMPNVSTRFLASLDATRIMASTVLQGFELGPLALQVDHSDYPGVATGPVLALSPLGLPVGAEAESSREGKGVAALEPKRLADVGHLLTGSLHFWPRVFDRDDAAILVCQSVRDALSAR